MKSYRTLALKELLSPKVTSIPVPKSHFYSYFDCRCAVYYDDNHCRTIHWRT